MLALLTLPFLYITASLDPESEGLPAFHNTVLKAAEEDVVEFDSYKALLDSLFSPVELTREEAMADALIALRILSAQHLLTAQTHRGSSSYVFIMGEKSKLTAAAHIAAHNGLISRAETTPALHDQEMIVLMEYSGPSVFDGGFWAEELEDGSVRAWVRPSHKVGEVSASDYGVRLVLPTT